MQPANQNNFDLSKSQSDWQFRSVKCMARALYEISKQPYLPAAKLAVEALNAIHSDALYCGGFDVSHFNK